MFAMILLQFFTWWLHVRFRKWLQQAWGIPAPAKNALGIFDGVDSPLIHTSLFLLSKEGALYGS
jgi:hypothetical protein